MKLPKLKKWKWISIALLLLLIVTNPSLNSFKQYCGLETKEEHDGVRRDANFFLFSLYSQKGDNYVAVLNNFIYMPERQPEKQRLDVYMDSIKKRDEIALANEPIFTVLPDYTTHHNLNKEDSIDNEIRKTEHNLQNLSDIAEQKKIAKEKEAELIKLKKMEKDIKDGKDIEYKKMSADDIFESLMNNLVKKKQKNGRNVKYKPKSEIQIAFEEANKSN